MPINKKTIENPTIIPAKIGNNLVGAFVAFKPNPRAAHVLDFTLDMNTVLVIFLDESWTPIAIEFIDLENGLGSKRPTVAEKMSFDDAIQKLFDIASKLVETVPKQHDNTDNIPLDDYKSVPPNKTFTVKTRYVYRGKGEPQKFDLDEE